MNLWQQIQSKVGARPDGIPGDATARLIADALGLAAPAPPVSSAWPRDKRPDMDAFYGEPGEHLIQIEPAYQLYYDGKKVPKISVHPKIADAVQHVFQKTLAHYGNKIHSLGLDVYDGCYNNRPKRGGSTLSVHAYAAALDFDADNNSLHQDHNSARFARPEYEAWWRFWEEEGAVSLGRTRDFDWMHVQFARL